MKLSTLLAAAVWAFALVGCNEAPPLATCPGIALLGDTITEVQSSGAAPTPMGGVVADGTYVLTSDEAYPPIVITDPPQQRSVTFQLTGTELKARIVSAAFPSGGSAVATFTTSGTQSTTTWTCGSAGTFTQGYTATATALTLIQPPGLVSTFTKQ